MRILFRLCFAVVRSCLLFVSLIVTGWFLVVSPTDQERRTLSLGPTVDDMRLREAVVQMRLARAALELAPDTAIDLIAGFGKGRVPREAVEQRLRAIADGRFEPEPQTAPVVQIEQRPAAGTIRMGGAKFVKPPE